MIRGIRGKVRGGGGRGNADEDGEYDKRENFFNCDVARKKLITTLTRSLRFRSSSDAPVASTDFMNVVGQSDTLPYSFETQAEASLSNKIRLLNKHVEEKSSVATMEEIMMRKESKGMAAQRLRKARLAADKKAKEKNLEITRLDKVNMEWRGENTYII